MAETKERKIIRTEHPHIVKVEGVCGGREVIVGTRIPVWLIANFWKMGMKPEEIAEEYELPLSQIFDALSYYLDHKDEIERQIEENRFPPGFPEEWEQIEEGIWVWRPKRKD
jgi:uncharacterized protein (DUF433 family)